MSYVLHSLLSLSFFLTLCLLECQSGALSAHQAEGLWAKQPVPALLLYLPLFHLPPPHMSSLATIRLTHSTLPHFSLYLSSSLCKPRQSSSFLISSSRSNSPFSPIILLSQALSSRVLIAIHSSEAENGCRLSGHQPLCLFQHWPPLDWAQF